MRITIAHHRSKQEVRESVDRAFNDLFQGIAGFPLQILVQQRTWQADTLNFSLTAKLAALSSPIRGTIEVTDTDLILDVDWGLLNRLIPEKATGELLGKRIRTAEMKCSCHLITHSVSPAVDANRPGYYDAGKRVPG
jgi:hypothetical protein